MKLTPETKIILCNYITDSLNSAKLKFVKDDDGNDYQLLDHLSPYDTVEEGKEEIDNIVEQIFFDMDNWDIKSIVVQI